MRGTVTIAAAVIVLGACMGPPGGGRGGGGRFGPEGPGGLGGLEPRQPRYINPGTLAALPGFTHAVRAGSTLYISGEVALDSTGKLVGPGDLGAQARQAFRQPRVRPQDRRSDARRRREADDLRGELFPARLRGHPGSRSRVPARSEPPSRNHCGRAVAAVGGAADRRGRDRRDTGDVSAAAAVTVDSSRPGRLPSPQSRTTARPNRLTGNWVEQPGQQRRPVQAAEQRSGIRGAVE